MDIGHRMVPRQMRRYIGFHILVVQFAYEHGEINMSCISYGKGRADNKLCLIGDS